MPNDPAAPPGGRTMQQMNKIIKEHGKMKFKLAG